MKHIRHYAITVGVMLLPGFKGDAQEYVGLHYPELSRAVFVGNERLWSAPSASLDSIKQTAVRMAENSRAKGLDTTRYHLRRLRSGLDDGDAAVYYIDAIITYRKDLVSAPKGHFLSYDEITPGYVAKDEQMLLSEMKSVRNNHDLEVSLENAEPSDGGYLSLLEELSIQLDSGNHRKINAIKLALAYDRWMAHFALEKCIIVNIPSARLTYFESNKELLRMRVVVGKRTTRTPRFAARCNSIILYPYWHVPKSIAVNELLPLCRKGPGILQAMGIQVLNSRGEVVNPFNINWKSVSKTNFPYIFRQTTGCGNALGVIKFNLTDPYSVYIHDTNFKGAFNLEDRYLSHGCIRIEQPIALAERMLPRQIDTAFLASCVRNQTPVIKDLPDPVPVFVVYRTVETDSAGKVYYYKDVYSLM